MHALSGGEAVADGARLLRREDLVPFLRKQVSERNIALMVEAARDDRPVAQNGGLLPPFNAPRSSMDQQIFQQVALNGGNLEMQRLNTGLAGFKTKGVAGLDALFTDEAREIHRGLSSYVKA